MDLKTSRDMGKLRTMIFKSKLLSPVKFCVFCFTKKEEAIRQAEASVGKENVTKKMIYDMLWVESRYHFVFDEYFTFDLGNANHRKKASFIPESELLSWCDCFNEADTAHIFRQKQDSYEYYKKYFKRELIYLQSDSEADENIFLDFTGRHSKFIVKPNDAGCGRDVRIIDLDKTDKSVSEIFKEIVTSNKSGVVVEELIRQSESMARLNASSVNTIRTITVNVNGRIEFLPPSCRVGYAGSVVDNGCISTGVDFETGIIRRVIDKHTGKELILHPDSGVRILGAQIPDWKDCIALSKELATLVPSTRYSGWDLAHTDNGWVLVEANNCSDMMSQYSHGIGCRYELTKWLKELNIKPFS